MTESIKRLPSQAPAPSRVRDEDQLFREQQEQEAWEEAYLIDGGQPYDY